MFNGTMKFALLLICILNYAAAQDEILDFPNAAEAEMKDVAERVTANATKFCKCVTSQDCEESDVVKGTNQACGNLEVCCSTQDRNLDLSTPPTPPYKSKGCGVCHHQGVGIRPTGGEHSESYFGQFPWMAVVLRKVIKAESPKHYLYQCGGALIHPQVVLTAAHCVGTKEEEYRIRLGVWDSQIKNPFFPYQDRDVSAVVVHPSYQANASVDDIAILILKKPVEVAQHIDVICLPKQGMVAGTEKCFTSGWGKNSLEKGVPYRVILQKLKVPILSQAACQESLRNTSLGQQYELDDSLICAGGEAEKYICKGDDGSPLVCPIPGLEDRYFLAGIVALRVGCGENRVPGVYTDVARFSEWIEEQLVKNSFNVSVFKY